MCPTLRKGDAPGGAQKFPGGFYKWAMKKGPERLGQGYIVIIIIHFNRVFHYKPSILGYQYFWKHPYSYVGIIVINHEIRIPSLTIQDSMESRRGPFFVAQVFVWRWRGTKMFRLRCWEKARLRCVLFFSFRKKAKPGFVQGVFSIFLPWQLTIRSLFVEYVFTFGINWNESKKGFVNYQEYFN